MINRIEVGTDAFLAPALASMPDAGLVDAISDKRSEDERWRQWKAKNRVDEARFRGRLRTVLIDIAAVMALGGAVWVALVI